MATWAFWFAVAALISGCGKFLDDYHIESATKERWRARLIRFFVWVDSAEFPDVPKAVRSIVLWPFRGRVVLRLPLTIIGLLAVSYIGITTTFFIAGGG